MTNCNYHTSFFGEEAFVAEKRRESAEEDSGTKAATGPFDEGYLLRLRSGDDETARHFDRHFRRLLRLKVWGKFTPQRGEDLINDVMAAAIQKILQGEPRDATRLSAYVCGICANFIRKEILPRPNNSGVELDFERMADTRAQTPEEGLLAREKAEAVGKVLSTLGQRDREVLVDLFYHEIGREEACRKYRVTRDQLRMILFHARQNFQKRWSGLHCAANAI